MSLRRERSAVGEGEETVGPCGGGQGDVIADDGVSCAARPASGGAREVAAVVAAAAADRTGRMRMW